MNPIPAAAPDAARDVFRDGGITVSPCSDGSPCLHLTMHLGEIEGPAHGIRALGRTMDVAEARAVAVALAIAAEEADGKPLAPNETIRLTRWIDGGQIEAMDALFAGRAEPDGTEEETR